MKNGKIIYVYDPMCGWCYCFSPVIKRLKEQYADLLEFEVLSGGMIIADRVEPISKMAAYIKQASKQAEEYTGATFGEAFLEGIVEEGSYLYSSELPSVALTVFKSFQPEQAVEFAHRIQHAFFYDGKTLNEVETYLSLLDGFDVDKAAFIEELKGTEAVQQINQEFRRVHQMGVRGFPALFFEVDGGLMSICRGYQPYDALKNVFEEILAMLEG